MTTSRSSSVLPRDGAARFRADRRQRGGARRWQARPPAYAVIDLRLEDGNGLDVVEACARSGPIAASWC
jgi:ActR/RegA family two-component response regulator